MTPDVRIDRELVGDGDVLPLLISERLEWTYAPSSFEELTRVGKSLEEGPRAVLALEAAEDRDAFVARLVARVGPLERVSDDELATAEAALGRPLPPLLRVLYRDVGAGGWCPEGGFLPPLGEHGLLAAWRRARREFRGPDRGDVWPDTLLPIVRAAGGETMCADASEPRLTLARLPASGSRVWAMGTPGLPNEASSLRGWLEAWLVGSPPPPTGGAGA